MFLVLTIRYINSYKRPWLIKREGGEYEQHAHMRTKKDALKVKELIELNKYSDKRDYQIAIQRLLTINEFKNLKRKPHYININKGIKK